MSAGKLADWARRGWLHSRQTPAQRLWILWADGPEVKRLRKLAALSHRGIVEYPPNSPRRRSGVDVYPVADSAESSALAESAEGPLEPFDESCLVLVERLAATPSA